MTERKKTKKKRERNIDRASVKQLQATQYTCSWSPQSEGVGKTGKMAKKFQI